MPRRRYLGGGAGSQAGGGAGTPQRRKLPAATATSRAGPRGSGQGPCLPRRAQATHPPRKPRKPRKRNLPLPGAEDPRGGLISRVQEAPGRAREKMEPESLYNLLQLPSEVALPTEELLPQGAKKKYLPPNSRKDPKFEELQKGEVADCVGHPARRDIARV
ncbi:uncharacterized protein LOC143397289 [Callospermophilus lateralis]|uniref:uncharacterized protein LOC143397289 n=1 Tax=Callospermophilus lateralis TaxID=76772 RepID=UPI0040545EED